MSFFLTEAATPEIYTLSLHDALPISARARRGRRRDVQRTARPRGAACGGERLAFYVPGETVRCVRGDRKSTRLNSSHVAISYAVFCLKKKTGITTQTNFSTPWKTNPQ